MKTTINRILNYVLYLFTASLLGTGLLLAFRLVPGSMGGKGLTLWGYDRHEWGDLHSWISYGFVLLLIAHLGLHWKWLVMVASKNHSWRLWAGFSFGLLPILVLLLYPLGS